MNGMISQFTAPSTLSTSQNHNLLQSMNNTASTADHSNTIGKGHIRQDSSAADQMYNILNKGLRSTSEPAQPKQLQKSDSTASFKENMRQRVAFTLVMKAALLPKPQKPLN